MATQIILKAYLWVLKNAGQCDLIAMYAGTLGDNAIEWYALCLTLLKLVGDMTEQQLMLMRRQDYGLAIEHVTIITADHTIEDPFTVGHSLQKR